MSTPGTGCSEWPAEVSSTTTMSLSFGSLRISAATAPPSMTGIIMSTMATSNGSPVAASRIAFSASRPPSKLCWRMPHESR